ncbi:MAG: HEPN domain-containing protein, partial [Desulfatibacillaceae bacterium]|nr:HEPN domain-containing protein [Desulfatibacillaceae bacterium]
KGNPLVTSFFKNKAVNRQYHTWFDWEANNANKFFSLFGSKFKDFMKYKVNNDSKLSDSISAFLELGNYRNQLVHQDFSSFPLEKTSKEIYQLYFKAFCFVNRFPELIKEFFTFKL